MEEELTDDFSVESVEIDQAIFDKLAQKEELLRKSLRDHLDVTAQPGLRPRRDL